MIKLAREIRFALSPREMISSRKESNTWAGWPASDRLVPHLILRCVLQGQPDPETGYLCNIKIVDEMLQQIALDRIIPFYWRAPGEIHASQVLLQIVPELLEHWSQLPDANGVVQTIELELSPFTKFTVSAKNFSTASHMVLLTQQFEFSAAHRLHCPHLSDAENQQIFGKCNHPSGHGHNYVVEVSVDCGAKPAALTQLESTVKRVVIDRLDHRHLNEDVDYFRTVNPSVENIVRAIFDWLKPELLPLQLKRVRVYETPKTWAEFEE
jgi:6-pyruvoyltetrahydropterin/6-carboxytetrahydropterin synthase